ncbi:MAG: DUF2868 domain-containing protein [Desulfobacteraceae bacterium]
MEKSDWTIGDVVNFEYFLNQGSNRAEGAVSRERDRKLYLEGIQPELGPGEEKKPGRVLKLWLERQKQEQTSTDLLPGDFYEESLRLLRLFFLIAGFGAGILVCGSLFSYTGSNPLNVFYFLSITVFFQLFLLVFLAGSFLLRSRFSRLSPFFKPFPLLGRLVEKMLLKTCLTLAGKVSAEQRSALYAAAGGARKQTRTHGTLFLWPVFILMQLLGVGFNLGLLGCTVFTVLVFDTAFGWQSTLQLGPGMVHTIVSLLALPWSWFLPASAAFPSLEQIEGSRIVLKDGITQLATGDLVSWWPFLCLAILFYGLLPRIALFIAGQRALWSTLKRQPFDHASCRRLLHRLMTPIVSTAAAEPEAPVLPDAPVSSGPPVSADTPGSRAKTAAEKSETRAGVQSVEPEQYLAFVPMELYDRFDAREFRKIVCRKMGSTAGTIHQAGFELDDDLKVVETFMAQGKDNNAVDLLLVYEAWQPPIRETLRFIRKARQALGPGGTILILLVGTPDSGTVFTAPRCDHQKIWEMKLKELNDSSLFIEPLVEPCQ